MVVSRFTRLFTTINWRQSLTVVMVVFGLLFSLRTPNVQAAPYGECTYGANAYGSGAACQATSPRSSSVLSGTGESWLRLAYLGGSAVLIAISLLLLVRALKRKSPAPPAN